MDTNNLDNLDAEEAELIAKLASIRATKNHMQELSNAYDEAIIIDKEITESKIPPYIEDIRFNSKEELVTFKVSKKSDLQVELKSRFNCQHTDYFNAPLYLRCTHSEWLELVKNTPSVKKLYYGNAQNDIAKHIPLPPFTIGIDNAYGKLTIVAGKNTSTYELRRIPGEAYYNSKHHIPMTEAWRLWNLTQEKYPTSVWSDEAKEYATSQIEKRTLLDIIAQKEVADNPITMNGMKFHDYQSISVDFIEARNGSGLIAHEMGLGKTPISIALIERLIKQNKSKHLIVCPASLVPNWINQIKKWTGANVYRFNTEQPMDIDVAEWIGKSDFNYFIINYDILSTVTKVKAVTKKNEKGEMVTYPPETKQFWVELLNIRPADSITTDEAHYIKNVESNRSKAVRDLHGDRKVLLTGTPLLNRPGELWALINCIDPVLSGGYESFIKAYTVDGKAARNIEELRETLKEVMFRKVKSQVMKELPPINRIVREYELSPSARSAYDKVLLGLWMELDNWDGDDNSAVAINGILAQIMKMKQVCAQDMISYTVDLANEAYEQAEGDNRKIIIFSQFVNKPEVIAEITNKLNLMSKALNEPAQAISITGEQSPSIRQDIVAKFTNDPNLHYLVASTKAVSEGLDITIAGTVIFHDLMWTPAAHHQAEGRAYGRMSDMHSINSYYLVAVNTIMADIMGLLEVKLNMFNAIIEGTETSRIDTSIAMEIIKNLKQMRKRGY
jgi:SNF2 family DNA or RNA helicase